MWEQLVSLNTLLALFNIKYYIIIGHIDHGKTTLTAAITKHLADKGKNGEWSD